jgi:hypothetical protein
MRLNAHFIKCLLISMLWGLGSRDRIFNPAIALMNHTRSLLFKPKFKAHSFFLHFAPAHSSFVMVGQPSFQCPAPFVYKASRRTPNTGD